VQTGPATSGAEVMGKTSPFLASAAEVEAAPALRYAGRFMSTCSAGSDRPWTYPAMAKCCAGDVALKITTDAVQVFGGRGQMHDDSTEKYVRDAGITEIHEGTSQIQ